MNIATAVHEENKSVTRLKYCNWSSCPCNNDRKYVSAKIQQSINSEREYDKYGYDKYGYDMNGYNSLGYDVLGSNKYECIT